MRRQYTSVIARIAPAWIPTLNKSERAPSQCSAISKCPVEEIGRNSVMPSMMPRMTTRKKSCMDVVLQAKSCASVRGQAAQRRGHAVIAESRADVGQSSFDLSVNYQDLGFLASSFRRKPEPSVFVFHGAGSANRRPA